MKKTSNVHDSNGRLVGRDTTTTHSDGCSTTVHQRAEYGSFGNVNATEITGVTTSNSRGESTHKPR